MHGSYRGIVIALVGWLALCGAAPPSEPSVSRDPAREIQQPATPTGDYAPYPDVNAERCYHSRDHDTADLCAQWRAAVAAEEAARSTWWGNIVGAFGAALSFTSIVLVVIALKQTEKSLKLAQRDRATATRRSVEAAAQARAEHSAFFEAERGILHAIGGQVGTLDIQKVECVCIEFINRGKSSARITKIIAPSSLPSGELFDAQRWTTIAAGGNALVAAFEVPRKNEIAEVECSVEYSTLGRRGLQSFFTVSIEWQPVSTAEEWVLIPRGWYVTVSNHNGHPDDT